MHQAKGVQCQSCHGSDMKNPQYPTEETCTQCHQKAALAEKTRNLPVQILMPLLITATASCAICSMKSLKTTVLSATISNS